MYDNPHDYVYLKDDEGNYCYPARPESIDYDLRHLYHRLPYEESAVEKLVNDYNQLFRMTDYENLDEWWDKAPGNEKVLISKIDDINCTLTTESAMEKCSIEELERMVRVLKKYIYGDGYESPLTGKKYDVDEII